MEFRTTNLQTPKQTRYHLRHIGDCYHELYNNLILKINIRLRVLHDRLWVQTPVKNPVRDKIVSCILCISCCYFVYVDVFSALLLPC